MTRLFVALRALVFGTAFVWFWGRVAASSGRVEAPGVGTLPAWTAPIGVVALACGAVLAVTCVALFVLRGEGTPAPFDAPRRFVAVGPYRIVRNPMYVGGWLALAGFGMLERSITMIAFSAVWLGLAHAFVMCYEERALAVRFGASYLEYCRRVPRWLPHARA